MQFKNVAFWLLIVLALGQEAPAEAMKYVVEPNHSNLGFSIPIFGGFTEVSGKFSKFDARILYDPESPETWSVTVTIPVSAIDTGIDLRDKDLQGETFFNAEKYPVIQFSSEKIQRIDDGYVAEGNLEMRGVTRPIRIPFQLAVHREEKGRSILGVRGSFKLNRNDFGVGSGFKHTVIENFLGDVVEVEIALWTKRGERLE